VSNRLHRESKDGGGTQDKFSEQSVENLGLSPSPGRKFLVKLSPEGAKISLRNLTPILCGVTKCKKLQKIFLIKNIKLNKKKINRN